MSQVGKNVEAGLPYNVETTIVDHALNAESALPHALRVSQASEHLDDVEVARPFFKLGRCETLIRFEVRCQFCASASSIDHAARRIVENIVD